MSFLVAHDIVRKEEALCLHLFGLKPEKFQLTNEEQHSGSHAIAWATIDTFVRKDFLGPQAEDVDIVSSTFLRFYKSPLWDWRTKTN